MLLFPIIVITFILLLFLHNNPQFYTLVYDVREVVDVSTKEKQAVVERVILVNDEHHSTKKMLNSAEYYFWRQINLDTLSLYPTYHMTFYRETKYLTRNFKEGNEYEPVYSHWDNTMDWRNHYKDRLCAISIFINNDRPSYYRCSIYNPGFFERFRNENDFTVVRFKNIKDFYIKKCNELGIKKNDMESTALVKESEEIDMESTALVKKSEEIEEIWITDESI